MAGALFLCSAMLDADPGASLVPANLLSWLYQGLGLALTLFLLLYVPGVVLLKRGSEKGLTLVKYSLFAIIGVIALAHVIGMGPILYLMLVDSHFGFLGPVNLVLFLVLELLLITSAFRLKSWSRAEREAE